MQHCTTPRPLSAPLPLGRSKPSGSSHRGCRPVPALLSPAELLASYDAAASSSPTLTKAATSLAGFGIADSIAQALQAALPGGTDAGEADAKKDDEGFSFDWARTARISAFGFLIYGPISGAWYGFLDTNVMPQESTSALAVALKVAADQILWAPILVSGLFAWELAGSQQPLISMLPSKLQQDLLPTLRVNWSFWPPFHVFNFLCVSPEQRILYVNVVQVLFNIFLCVQASRVATSESSEAPSKS